MERSHSDAGWRLADSPSALERRIVALVRWLKALLLFLAGMTTLLPAASYNSLREAAVPDSLAREQPNSSIPSDLDTIRAEWRIFPEPYAPVFLFFICLLLANLDGVLAH